MSLNLYHLYCTVPNKSFSSTLIFLFNISSSLPAGQQRNPLQGENDNTSKEAQGVLQPETGERKEMHSNMTMGQLSVDGKLKCARKVVFSQVCVLLCVLQGVPASTLRFLFEGQRIADNQTPKEVKGPLRLSL